MSNWSAKNPYNSKITENYVLNGEGSRKETRHIVFDLGDSGLDYKVGDALGVLPENPPHIVEELIEVQGWDRDQTVASHKGEKDLYTALKKTTKSTWPTRNSSNRSPIRSYLPVCPFL